jgi:catechol-2,3-dioxygenase
VSWSLISSIGHVALRVKDLEASVSDAVDVLGLRETERVAGTAYLTHGQQHHSLQYIQADEDALDHLAFEASSLEALRELRERIDRAGCEIVSDSPLELGIEHGFAFVGPGGFVCELYVGMAEALPGLRAAHAPNRLGHFTLNPRDVEPMGAFFQTVLGFRVSDVVTGGNGWFLRCNVDHHGVAVVPGRGAFHHAGWEAQSIADLGHLADRLDERDRHLLWGPVRHGLGRNIAAYYVEPCGAVVELYTDLERIYADDFAPRTWDFEDRRWYNLWGTYRPDGFRDFGVLPAAVPAA